MTKPFTLIINLTNQQIEASLTKVDVGLAKYLTIQTRLQALAGKPLKGDTKFRKCFNGFYRIRQKPAAWYDAFYSLLDESRNQPVDFATVLRALHQATDRYEASFASKLVATLHPNMPVIDSIVLKHLNVKLPYGYDPNRFETLCSLHRAMNQCYIDYLQTEQGRHLIDLFRDTYPHADITGVKMLDLVLWQNR